MIKFIKRAVIILVILGAVIFLAFKLSPYPSVWMFRYVFNNEAVRVNKELRKFVPEGIGEISDIRYDAQDDDALLDVYFPENVVASGKKLPLVVWTHGGGLISGDKGQVANYCRILSGRGYVVASIDYTIAPEAKYPTPMRQLNKALAYLSAHADSLHADASFIVLAGDSGGSMISAATANIITDPSYAAATKVQPGLLPGQLKGLLLFCGIYEIDNMNKEGAFGTFLNAAVWGYFGKKDITGDAYAKTASVTHFLTSRFPPAFISAGNTDPLLPQSRLLAGKLSALQVPIDTLFFPPHREPALQHEYQFKLDDAGQLALDRSVRFLSSLGSR